MLPPELAFCPALQQASYDVCGSSKLAWHGVANATDGHQPCQITMTQHFKVAVFGPVNMPIAPRHTQRIVLANKGSYVPCNISCSIGISRELARLDQKHVKRSSTDLQAIHAWLTRMHTTPRCNSLTSTSLLIRAVLVLLCVQAISVQADNQGRLDAISIRNAVDAVHAHRVDLSVNVTTIKGSHAWAEVRWRSVHRPSFDDWVGVLAPADAHVKSSTPVKYKLATDAPTHFAEGYGSLTCAA